MQESFAVSGLARFIAGRSNLGFTLALAVLAHYGRESTTPPSGGASLSLAHTSAMRQGAYFSRVASALCSLNEDAPTLIKSLCALASARVALHRYCLSQSQDSSLSSLLLGVTRTARTAVLTKERQWQLQQAHDDVVLRQHLRGSWSPIGEAQPYALQCGVR